MPPACRVLRACALYYGYDFHVTKLDVSADVDYVHAGADGAAPVVAVVARGVRLVWPCAPDSDFLHGKEGPAPAPS